MINGKNIVGFSETNKGIVSLSSFNASTLEALPEAFTAATGEEVEKAMALATAAARPLANSNPEGRARFLEAIADEIEALGDALLERASTESGLPVGRFQGERGRTCSQLRLFAQVIREGSWVEATIDTANSDRIPLPKPDIRKMLTGIGPVLVFTASNFPLAFSTAGGDAASALAAGCPVIIKAHEAHLGTNELVSRAIASAARKTNMPEGVFSSLNGDGFKTGEQLINHPNLKGVAFTGSFNGGMALYKMAQNRKEPIPVFAEMGSINPVVLLPGMLKEDADNTATTYAKSITLGVGQFCTNPGLLLGISSPELEAFKESLTRKLNETTGATMLTHGISKNYEKNRRNAISQQGVNLLTNTDGSSTLTTASAQDFITNPTLHHEVFGPMSLLIECTDQAELIKVINSLEGQLTGTIMASSEDRGIAGSVAEALQEKVGRILWNGTPTGVEVCHAMHHGGPFPATTDSRFTSVGAAAIKRFARSVCYQNFPNDFLPGALKHDNILGILRKVDGKWES